jgi:hypothetical protein
MARHHFSASASRQHEVVELRFVSRSDQRRCLAFPCDATGRVDLDALNERERNNYLFARAVMGRDFAFPVVVDRQAAKDCE